MQNIGNSVEESQLNAEATYYLLFDKTKYTRDHKSVSQIYHEMEDLKNKIKIDSKFQKKT